jgi:hypothetical protein
MSVLYHCLACLLLTVSDTCSLYSLDCWLVWSVRVQRCQALRQQHSIDGGKLTIYVHVRLQTPKLQLATPYLHNHLTATLHIVEL